MTVIASPLSPGTFTPPFSVVGIGSAASCGMYLKSSEIVRKLWQTRDETLPSVTWAK